MILIINLKNKLNNTQIDDYMSKVKNQKLVVCIPGSYKVNDFKNSLLQNFSEISDILESNCIGAIIGHHDFNEDLTDLNNKLKKLIDNNLYSVVCLGEKIKDVNSEETLKIQIDIILKDVSDFKKIIIAYEPLWAIGGDKKLDSEYIIKNISAIKCYINSKYKTDIKIIYGGSVNEKTINMFEKTKKIDGFLISTYALNYKNVIDLCN